MSTVRMSAPVTAADRESVNRFRGFGLIDFHTYVSVILQREAERAGRNQ